MFSKPYNKVHVVLVLIRLFVYKCISKKYTMYHYNFLFSETDCVKKRLVTQPWKHCFVCQALEIPIHWRAAGIICSHETSLKFKSHARNSLYYPGCILNYTRRNVTKAGVFQKQKYLPLLHVANRHEYSLRRLVQH